MSTDRQSFARVRALVAIAAVVLLPASCKREPQAPPGPGANAGAAYGYKVWNIQPRSVELGPNVVADPHTGQVTATGIGIPNMREPDDQARTAYAQAEAMARAEAYLRQAIGGLTVEISKSPARWMPLSTAMEEDASVRNRVEAVLKKPRVVSRQQDWYWKVQLIVNLKENERLYDSITIFHPRRSASEPGGASMPTDVQTGAPFPAFKLRDLLGDRVYDTARLPGKAQMFVFWTPEDLENAQALTRVEAFYKRFRGRGLEVVGVVARGDRAAAYRLAVARGLSFLNLVDQDSRLARKLGLQALPIYIVVWRNPNVITYYAFGESSRHLNPRSALYQMVQAHLAGKATP